MDSIRDRFGTEYTVTRSPLQADGTVIYYAHAGDEFIARAVVQVFKGCISDVLVYKDSNRRKGIGTALYALIEAELGRPLVPRELSASREQQAATSEILKVISSSPMDLQRVFAEMAASAARVCDAYDATIRQVDGDVLRLVAHQGPIPIPGSLPLTREVVTGDARIDARSRRHHRVGNVSLERGQAVVYVHVSRRRRWEIASQAIKAVSSRS